MQASHVPVPPASAPLLQPLCLCQPGEAGPAGEYAGTGAEEAQEEVCSTKAGFAVSLWSPIPRRTPRVKVKQVQGAEQAGGVEGTVGGNAGGR